MITAWLPLMRMFALCMMRPFGVMLVLPVTNARILGGGFMRNVLVMLVALPVMPHALVSADRMPADVMPLLFLCLTEIAAGLYIGFLAAIPFWAIDAAGSLIDMVRGSGLAELLNPTSGEQTSLFSLLFLQLLSALFFSTGGFTMLLEAIYRSYQLLPLGGSLSWDRNTLAFMIAQWRLLFDMGINFALPAIAIMIMIDLALGLINRTTEQLDVFFLAMPIKSLLACLVLALAMGSTLHHFTQYFHSIWPATHQLFTQ